MSDEQMESAYQLGMKHGRYKALFEVQDMLTRLVSEIRTQGAKSLVFPVRVPPESVWRDLRVPGPDERLGRAEINLDGLLWIREQVERKLR